MLLSKTPGNSLPCIDYIKLPFSMDEHKSFDQEQIVSQLLPQFMYPSIQELADIISQEWEKKGNSPVMLDFVRQHDVIRQRQDRRCKDERFCSTL
mmetsp:Transcript_7658/g.14906  ORF Transcript_7658/g.14906 Transcript_7658/m.14906 type:complete len:95 (-) Transcript_7658:2537-2821(-)|eukprot:scaffold3134_cov182-Amphora_coffeaeformis.AAC.2